MVYNDVTNKLGICQEIDALCDTGTTSYPVADKTRRVNAGLEQVIGWIINADGTWQFDDSNYTDEPRGKGTLVEGQVDYTFASDYLQVEAMDVLDLNNAWVHLKPLDHSELNGQSPEEYFGTTSTGAILTGLPQYYDLFTDDSFRLYPAPSATYCTLTNGLRVWFKRTAHLFEATDTTETPGFASPYHVILAYMAALPYCMTYKKDRIALYEKKIMDLKNEIINHYAKREKEKRKQITINSTMWR